MRRFAVLWLILITACSPLRQDQIAREAARTAINPVLREQFPGVPITPISDCVIDNATREQLLSLAADAVTGPTAATFEKVAAILRQPQTLQCIARSGLAEDIVRQQVGA